jgi:hypothetical protein
MKPPASPYYNHKMRREALVPVDEELERAIGEHRQRLRTEWPEGTPRLFPRLTGNPGGRRPVSDDAYRKALHRWLERCDIRDEYGQPVHLSPMFITTPQFLPQHHQQRQQVIQIISAAEARGQQRLAEMNRQVLGNLDQIIATLETPADKKGTGAADAC